MPRLAVTSLLLSHFRSHRRTLLEFDGRPVALHGPNGAGKTNVLEALSLLSPGRGLRRAAVAEMARRPEALGWKIAAELCHGSARHAIETRAEPGEPRLVVIDGKPAPQAALGRIVRMLWLIPSMDRLWIEGAEGRRRFLDRMTMSFEPAHADAVLAYEKAMRERNRLLRDEVRDVAWYEALEAQMAESGAAIIGHRQAALRRVAAAQDPGDAVFPAAALSIVAADGEEMPQSREELARALSAGRDRDRAAGRTLAGPHRADLAALYQAKGMPAAQASTGEQKALLLSLVLANARALAEDLGAPPILLLDEVAAHLDADRRAALHDRLVDLGGQAFLTGTGAELFATLSGRAQFFEVVERDGVSIVRAAPR